MLWTFVSITLVAGCKAVLDKVRQPRPKEITLDKLESLFVPEMASELWVVATLKDIQFELLWIRNHNLSLKEEKVVFQTVSLRQSAWGWGKLHENSARVRIEFESFLKRFWKLFNTRREQIWGKNVSLFQELLEIIGIFLQEGFSFRQIDILASW